jgi:hypothetical protein
MDLLIVCGGIVALLSIFALLAMRFGHDSREPFDSPEWERRQLWYGGKHQDWRH